MNTRIQSYEYSSMDIALACCGKAAFSWLNHPGFDAHFVMCEPRALARLLSVGLFFCLRQRTPLKTVHEALCVVAVYPCLSDLLEVSQCCNRPVRNGEPSLYTRSSKPDGCLGKCVAKCISNRANLGLKAPRQQRFAEARAM